MNDAHTADAVFQRLGQKARKQCSRFVAVQAVQVDFILNDPPPTAQIAQYG